MPNWRTPTPASVGLLAAISVILIGATQSAGQQTSTQSTLAPAPRNLTTAEVSDLSKYDKQLVKIPGAKVLHVDTAQVFLFGEKAHPVHVLIPAPAIDAAHEGDVVELTGFARHYDPKAFEKEYRWFHQPDYPDVHAGDWVIVATSVHTPEGTELVPGSTISTTPATAPKPTSKEKK